MNNKLLKLCVAVALIAGAEDGVCARGGGTSSNRERVFERSETSVGVEAKVKALVNVEFGNQGQTLSLVGDDGSKDTKNNTYKFEVNSFAVGYALRFDLLDSQGNLRKDEDTVIENDDGDKLKIVGRLLDGKDKVVSESCIGSEVPFDPEEQSLGEWKLKLEALLNDDVYAGTYTGTVKISVQSAN